MDKTSSWSCRNCCRILRTRDKTVSNTDFRNDDTKDAMKAQGYSMIYSLNQPDKLRPALDLPHSLSHSHTLSHTLSHSHSLSLTHSKKIVLLSDQSCCTLLPLLHPVLISLLCSYYQCIFPRCRHSAQHIAFTKLSERNTMTFNSG